MGQSRDVPRTSDTPPGIGLRRFTVIWLIITLLSAPFGYGIFLFLTLPVLSGLLVALFVGGGNATARVWASLFGPVLLINVVWFAGRADERPVEGVIAGSMVLLSAFALVRLRRSSRTPMPIGLRVGRPTRSNCQ